MLSVVGLDLSLTSTGVATREGTFCLKPRSKGEARLVEIRNSLDPFVCPFGHPVDLTVLEGYSYGSQFRGEVMGELGGVVKVWLYEQGYSYVVVPPAVVKLFATGKGNASKDHVLVQAVSRSGIEFRTNDEAEAWWLYAMGKHALGEPVVELPAHNLTALKKVEWPRRVAA
jgi:Holliday junction resolvasome RuvABC endonuclease subunit